MLNQQQKDADKANEDLAKAARRRVQANEKAPPQRGFSVSERSRRYDFFAARGVWPAVAMKLSKVFSVTRNQRIWSFWNAVVLS